MLQQLEDLEPFQMHAAHHWAPQPQAKNFQDLYTHQAAPRTDGWSRQIERRHFAHGKSQEETVKKSWVCTLIEDPSCKACKQCPSSDLAAGQAMLHGLVACFKKPWHLLVLRESGVDSLFGCAA